MSYTLLIVEDHPLVINAYIKILEQSTMFPVITFLTCKDCYTAYELLSDNKVSIDMLIIDYRIPPYLEKKLLNGEDLAVFIKKKFSACKIIMITSHTEAFLVYNVVKRINLDGFLSKGDFDDKQLVEIFEDIVKGKIYYSRAIKDAINAVKPQHNLYLDETNRKIIQLVSEGYRTPTIADKLGLAKITIDKRKVVIKDMLNVKGGDEAIITEAKRLSYI